MLLCAPLANPMPSSPICLPDATRSETPIPSQRKTKEPRIPNRAHRIIANLPPLALRPDNSPKKKSHRLSSRINTSSPLPPALLSLANLSLLACAAACSPTRYGSSRRRVRSRALSSSTIRSSSMMRRASWMWRWRVSWWAAAERRRATRAVGDEMVDHEGMRKCPRVGMVGTWWLRRGPEGTGGRPGVGGELLGEEGRREGRREEGRGLGVSPRGEYGGRGSGLRMVEW